jgi:hypothetical protein
MPIDNDPEKTWDSDGASRHATVYTAREHQCVDLSETENKKKILDPVIWVWQKPPEVVCPGLI